MGIKLSKYTCTINSDVLKQRIDEIEGGNSSLSFVVTDKIDNSYFDSFISCNALLNQFLSETFNESIAVLDKNSLNQILQGTFFRKKIFALIISDSKVVGYQEVSIESTNRATLENLYLSSAYRNKNLGIWLVGAVLLEIKSKYPDIKLLETNVNDTNKRALNTLNKFDFFHKYSIEEILKNRN